MFDNFIAFYTVGVSFLRRHVTIFNSFYPTPRQHLFWPFSTGARSVPHHTRYTPRRASSRWPRHAWFRPGPDSRRSRRQSPWAPPRWRVWRGGFPGGKLPTASSLDTFSWMTVLTRLMFSSVLAVFCCPGLFIGSTDPVLLNLSITVLNALKDGSSLGRWSRP